MANTDNIKVKDLAWIQRLEIEIDVDDSQVISNLQKIIDNDIHDGVFSIHFTATAGLSYECFGYKKYGEWVDCLILCYYNNYSIDRLLRSRIDGWTHMKINTVAA